MSMICWKCKEETFDDSNFCVYCGADLKTDAERRKSLSIFVSVCIVFNMLLLLDSVCAFPLGLSVTWYLMWFSNFGVCILVVGGKSFLFCMLNTLCLMMLFSMRRNANTYNIADYFRFVVCIRVCCVAILTLFYGVWISLGVVSFRDLFLPYALELTLNLMFIVLFSYVVRLGRVTSTRSLIQSLCYVWEKVGE